MAFGLNRHRKLRNLIINRKFQFKYATMLVSWVFALSCMLSIVLFGILHDQARERTLGLPGSAGYGHMTTIVVTAVTFAGVTSLAVAIWTIFMSHRIAGPMMMVHRWLRELADGRYPVIRAFRKGDEFQEIQVALADAVTTLKERESQQFENLAGMAGLARNGLAGGPDECRRCLSQIAAQLETVERAVCERTGEQASPPATATSEPERAPVEAPEPVKAGA